MIITNIIRKLVSPNKWRDGCFYYLGTVVGLYVKK